MSEINDAAVEITIADELMVLDDLKDTLIDSHVMEGVIDDDDVVFQIRVLNQISKKLEVAARHEGYLLALIDDMRGVVEAFADIMRESGRADYAAELDQLVYRAEEFLLGAETTVKEET